MDYKQIIKNPETRKKILDFFSFVPDKTMLYLQYYIKQKRFLNLNKPQLYTEKLQWYKLNYKNPLMIKCVDKYDVREFVSSKGHEDILTHCYGVYDDPNQIKFEDLPDSFVLKDTLGGGSRGVIITPNKADLNWDLACEQMSKWVNQSYKKPNLGREWPYYSGKKHRIIVEEYIDSNPEEGGLIDYKFFCFNGEPYFLYVIADRNIGYDAGIGIYNSKFERLPFNRADERPLSRSISKPKNYDKMLEIVRSLSEDFPHVRVDLYNVDGKIIFGETTFYPGSGYMHFSPAEFDKILGDVFELPSKTSKRGEISCKKKY